MIRLDVLNFSSNTDGCVAADRGSMFTVMVISRRAFGGSRARKLRAVLPDFGLKGEKAVVTEVMNFVIIFVYGSFLFFFLRTGRAWRSGLGGE